MGGIAYTAGMDGNALDGERYALDMPDADVRFYPRFFEESEYRKWLVQFPKSRRRLLHCFQVRHRGQFAAFLPMLN